MNRTAMTLGLAISLTTLATSANAAIINGDFEQTPNSSAATNTFPGWEEQANPVNGLLATLHPGLGAGGGDNAAKLMGFNGGAFVASGFSADANWQIDFDLAIFDPDTENGRVFQLFLPHAGGNRVSLIAQRGTVGGTTATVRVFDQSLASPGFVTIAENALDYSTADDVNVNHLRIVGDYSTENPSYTVSITNSSNVTVDSAPLAAWQGTSPAQGDGLVGLRFETSSFQNTDKFFVVDNVAIPEPTAAAAVLGLAGMALRRRKPAA